MRRWLMGIAVMGGLLGLSPMAHAETTPSGPILMEMVVLIPHGHRLAIFQQMVLKSRTPADIGLLPGHGGIEIIGGKRLTSANRTVEVVPQGRHLALRYSVPWNGQSISLSIFNPSEVRALLLLTPPRVGLPPILNPALQSLGQGRLPGVPNSPVFQEYGTTAVHAGQSLTLVLERNHGASTDALYTGSGNYPWAGRLAEWGLGILALGGLWLALNWRRVPRHAASGDMRFRMLAELAAIRSAFRRGEISEEGYQTQRSEIVRLLKDSQGASDV
ncbi:hypothetical protein [Sulfobacillus harzensis]|uniref:SHOCT domain-containing protein n=1 Tax=Sulfobacillus harzensis TaxID=2729629 RepID=A0A7Y0L5A1_9FIRM|nr:hypothetical protein [Sulfobacillus harzensis]NMP23577.1 hypothetical protein [Sulfobacillus harzensis]